MIDRQRRMLDDFTQDIGTVQRDMMRHFAAIEDQSLEQTGIIIGEHAPIIAPYINLQYYALNSNPNTNN